MKTMRIASLASAMLLAASSMAAIASPPALRVAEVVDRSERRIARQARGQGVHSKRRPGPGWSNRHVKRLAAKRRNRASNRAAHRG